MAVNSKSKGRRGEQECVKFLKSLGFEDAKRTAQYNGLLGKGDVVCEWSLPGLNIEVKFGYSKDQFDLNSTLFQQACAQAARDSPDGKKWVLLWKPKGGRYWRITYDQDGTYPTLSGDYAIKSTLKYVWGLHAT